MRGRPWVTIIVKRVLWILWIVGNLIMPTLLVIIYSCSINKWVENSFIILSEIPIKLSKKEPFQIPSISLTIPPFYIMKKNDIVLVVYMHFVLLSFISSFFICFKKHELFYERENVLTWFQKTLPNVILFKMIEKRQQKLISTEEFFLSTKFTAWHENNLSISWC